jgi:hypothetical protein
VGWPLSVANISLKKAFAFAFLNLSSGPKRNFINYLNPLIQQIAVNGFLERIERISKRYKKVNPLDFPNYLNNALGRIRWIPLITLIP